MYMRVAHRKQSSHATMFLLSHHCTVDDLLKFNDIGKKCARNGREKCIHIFNANKCFKYNSNSRIQLQPSILVSKDYCNLTQILLIP